MVAPVFCTSACEHIHRQSSTRYRSVRFVSQFRVFARNYFYSRALINIHSFFATIYVCVSIYLCDQDILFRYLGRAVFWSEMNVKIKIYYTRWFSHHVISFKRVFGRLNRDRKSIFFFHANRYAFKNVSNDVVLYSHFPIFS